MFMTIMMKRSSRSSGSRNRNRSDERQALGEVFPTSLGWMGVVWGDDVLHGIVFGHGSQRQAQDSLARSLPWSDQLFCTVVEGQPSGGSRWVRDLVEGLRQFADGEPVDFAAVPLALGHLTSFGRRVVGACRRIPWGQTRSYGELAMECGSPGAARAVGSVMAKNRYPLVVPCHRVVGAGGSLGGYSAPQGVAMKRRLLALECGCGV
jgi:methylated-DNA-[protein]-cysteine S-methyltransferase